MSRALPGNFSVCATAVLALSLGLGLSIPDCALIGFGALLAVPAFRIGMELMAPWEGWRAAIRCWLGGIGLIVTGMLVGVIVSACYFASTDPGRPSVAALPVLLLMGTLAIATAVAGARSNGVSLSSFGAGSLVWWWLACLGGVAALVAGLHGSPVGECLYAASGALALVIYGWRLVHGVVPEIEVSTRR